MGWINPSRALRLNEGYRCYCMTDISMQSFQKKKKRKGKRCDKAVLCDHFDNYILDSYLYHIHVINWNG